MRRNILTPEELTLFTAQPGTKEWAMRKKQRIEEKIDAAEDDIINLDIEAVDFIQGEGWQLLPCNEQGDKFRVFKEFALADRPYGLGCTEKQFRIIVAVCDSMTKIQQIAADAELQPERVIGIVGGKAGPGRGKKTNDNNKSFYGTSSEYLTDVIARDHPAIYDGMLRGQYRSVRQAAIEAGIVTPQTRYSVPSDPIAAGRYLARRVDREWFDSLIDAYYKAIEE